MAGPSKKMRVSDELVLYELLHENTLTFLRAYIGVRVK
jgi:hypothetical protein